MSSFPMCKLGVLLQLPFMLWSYNYQSQVPQPFFYMQILAQLSRNKRDTRSLVNKEKQRNNRASEIRDKRRLGEREERKNNGKSDPTKAIFRSLLLIHTYNHSEEIWRDTGLVKGERNNNASGRKGDSIT